MNRRETEQIDVFVCYTIFHVYISVLKSLERKKLNNKRTILILTDHIKNILALKSDNTINNIFDEVYIIYDNKLTEQLMKNLNEKKNIVNSIEKCIGFKRSINNLLLDNNEFLSKFDQRTTLINIFLDQPITSIYFMNNYLNVNLIEDGVGLYKNDKFTFKRKILFLFGWPLKNGFDKKIKSIEASKPNKLNNKLQKKVKELNLAKMTGNLTDKDKKMILDIFLNDKMDNMISLKNSVLLVTQPFSEIGMMLEKEKIAKYKNIINKYLKNRRLIIKPHPSELTNYGIIFKNAIILDREFPLEIFNLIIEEKGDLVISISSSAINNLICFDNKILVEKIY